MSEMVSGLDDGYGEMYVKAKDFLNLPVFCFFFPSGTALLSSFSLFGSSSRIRDCRAVKWGKKAYARSLEYLEWCGKSI